MSSQKRSNRCRMGPRQEETGEPRSGPRNRLARAEVATGGLLLAALLFVAALQSAEALELKRRVSVLAASISISALFGAGGWASNKWQSSGRGLQSSRDGGPPGGGRLGAKMAPSLIIALHCRRTGGSSDSNNNNSSHKRQLSPPSRAICTAFRRAAGESRAERSRPAGRPDGSNLRVVDRSQAASGRLDWALCLADAHRPGANRWL